jgi:membrane associated rhomboid family serine protease
VILMLLTSAAYVALYVWALWKNDWKFEPITINPWVGPSQSALLQVGAQASSLLTVAHEWWRLVSSLFVSAGAISLAGSLVALWSFGTYLDRALPLPALSVPVIYLLGGVMGAAASANLNVLYVTCGSLAGPAAMMGKWSALAEGNRGGGGVMMGHRTITCIGGLSFHCSTPSSPCPSSSSPLQTVPPLHLPPLSHSAGGVWSDQMLNSSKYANCGATFFVLVLTTAMFVGISLLPLMGIWYTVVAIITGFCAATVFLLLPSVNKAQQRSNSSGWVILQILCALLIIGAATARYARGRVNAGARICKCHPSTCLTNLLSRSTSCLQCHWPGVEPAAGHPVCLSWQGILPGNPVVGMCG